jgi:hypothetical protein
LAVLGRDAEVGRERELESHPHRPFLDRRDDRFPGALGGGHVPGQVMHSVALDPEEARNVAARRVETVGPSDHDDADFRVLVHGGNDRRDLGASLEGNDVHRRPVEDQIAGARLGILLPAQPVEVLRVVHHDAFSCPNAEWPSGLSFGIEAFRCMSDKSIRNCSRGRGPTTLFI